MPAKRVPERFRIIAHRGASAYAPENTRAAFRLARKMGAREVELDVRCARDGVPVVCHDEVLARYGHGQRRVEDLSSEELLSLDMGSWYSPRFKGEPMLSLAALFEEFGEDFTYHVELKGRAAGLAARVLGLIGEHGLTERCILTSFSRDRLSEAMSVVPGCRCGWLVESIEDDVLRAARAMGLYQVCPRAELVERPAVARAHEVSSEVRAWGVSGDRDRVEKLVSRLVDAGCDGTTIDWPDWFVSE